MKTKDKIKDDEQDQEIKRRFVELRIKGLSFEHIAQELKVSKQTLIEWSKDFKCEISNLKQIEIESLYEKYSMLNQQRIELFGQKFKVIKDEPDKRDLKSLSTENLFELFLKYFSAFKEEVEDMVFKGIVESGDVGEILKESGTDEFSWDV